MDCKAISVFLVVLAVAVPTQAISCLQCASFDLAGATEAQQYMAVGILTALSTTPCEANTTSTVCSEGPQCQTINMASKLGGNGTYNAVVYGCAKTEAADICAGLNGLAAAAGITVDECSAADCSTENCNVPSSGVSVTADILLVLCAIFVARLGL